MRYGVAFHSILFSAAMASAAVAHPHVFIDTEIGFKFDDAGKLNAVRVTWGYDAFSSLRLFEILDLDADRDGELDDIDRTRIITVQTTWPDGFEGDTYLEQDGEPISLLVPENQSTWLEDAQIHVAFDLPLAEPIDPVGEIVLRPYDPTYHIAFTVVELEDELKDGCTVELLPFKKDKATAALLVQLAQLTREETPEQENVGRGFADQVWLTCG